MTCMEEHQRDTSSANQPLNPRRAEYGTRRDSWVRRAGAALLNRWCHRYGRVRVGKWESGATRESESHPTEGETEVPAERSEERRTQMEHAG